MGPERACKTMRQRFPTADRFEVTLYGSLAMTGKGHLTDEVIVSTLMPIPTEVIFVNDYLEDKHPNTMLFRIFEKNALLHEQFVYSVGGGSIEFEGEDHFIPDDCYPLRTYREISDYCTQNNLRIPDYVERCEGKEIWEHLSHTWAVMKSAIERGLNNEGVLPGGLGLRRKAGDYMIRAKTYGDWMRSRGMLYAYALAVSEENASGGEIVTAPTCGSCGVLPAVLYHLQNTHDFVDVRILRALATAGLFGSVVRANASVSGAEVGCQGEVGVACAMAAAAANQLMGGTPAQIEYAAEMGLEHHLGLTCDPVCGLVQIPCIERNVFAAARAVDAGMYSLFSDGKHRVTFDRTVKVMKQTGHDLPSLYKETAEGGLATIHE